MRSEQPAEKSGREIPVSAPAADASPRAHAVARVKPEDRLVEKIRALVSKSPSLAIGPGDDAAVVRREAGLLAATTDMLVEGVDFLADEDPERLGRRAAAVNLSDLAAMGAEPEFFLLSIAFPAERGEQVPLGIVRGAIARSAPYGAALAGGDLSAAPLLVVSSRSGEGRRASR